MEQEHIFISGGSKGLGKALVERLLARPTAKIFAFSRNPGNVEQELLDTHPEWHDRVQFGKGDASNQEDITRLVAEATTFFGEKPNKLILNAGVFYFDDELDKKKAGEMQKLNVESNKMIIDKIIAEDKEKQLHVLFISSIGALAEEMGKAFEHTTKYGKTKAEVDTYLKELATTNDHIRVALSYPGPFGDSAKKLRDRFGDTWAVPVETVARHSAVLLESLHAKKLAEEIIVSEKHFSIESSFFDPAELLKKHIALTEIPENESEHLIKKDEPGNEIRNGIK